MHILEFNVTGKLRRGFALIAEDIDLRFPFDDLENQSTRAWCFSKCLNIGYEISQGKGRCQTRNEDLKIKTLSDWPDVTFNTHHHPMASCIILTFLSNQLRSIPKDNGDAPVQNNIHNGLCDSQHQTFLDTDTFSIREILRVSTNSEQSMHEEPVGHWSYRSASFRWPPNAVTVRIAPSTSWAMELAVLYAFSSKTVNLMMT